MRKLLVIIGALLLNSTICAQDGIKVPFSYCIDEELSLSKENVIDRIFCSGGCDIRLYFIVDISKTSKFSSFFRNNCYDLTENMKKISFYAYLKGYNDTLLFQLCDWDENDTSVIIPMYSILPETSHPMSVKYRLKDLKKRHYSKFKNELNKLLVLYISIDTVRYYLKFADIDMPAYDEDKYRIKRRFCY